MLGGRTRMRMQDAEQDFADDMRWQFLDLVPTT